MPSPTYALTSPSSQSLGAVDAWNSCSGRTNGAIASSGSTPSSASRSWSRTKWRYSAVAIPATARLSATVGAMDASAASRSNAMISP